jgi:2-succinyl-6-hydroxy-2,4-cyclohexadiene-1-carboxylate synthase
MPIFTVDQTRYHYEEAGAGELLLLLHGFTGCTQNWREVMALLQPRMRVIAIDLPGHGQTEAPRDVSQFTLPVIARQLSAFIVDIVGSPVHVLGYSMGGRLALYLALHHSEHVHSLVLESASPGLASAEERAARMASDEALAQRIERDGIQKFVDEWTRLPLFASQAQVPVEARDRLRALRLQNDPAGLALSLRGMGTGVQPPLWDRLNEWRKPALLIAGEHDAKFVAINRQMAQRMPASTLRILPNAGHAVHFEHPHAYSQLMESFL